MRTRWSAGIAAGAFFVVTAYGSSFILVRKQSFLVTDTNRREAFDKICCEYDKKTDFQEFILGITYYRKRILKENCRGKVLEVGAGTGKNIGCFNQDKVSSVVFCDQSKGMVKVMERKHKEQTSGIADRRSLVPHTFQVTDSENLPFDDNTFDTVIDMFGLCSYDEPIQALREMSRVCSPGGKILLLEHGRGTKEWLNNYIDKTAPSHACSWGCWWNRDIRRIIRLSGLKCIQEKDLHFGTTMIRVCRPSK
mmetsp:Transcript_33623/g.52556  ORF Transcript_33623/g.52556 Transcript_33623/m.52556 type:complete len:251 (-) Transcript_33623:81-833(-)